MNYVYNAFAFCMLLFSAVGGGNWSSGSRRSRNLWLSSSSFSLPALFLYGLPVATATVAATGATTATAAAAAAATTTLAGLYARAPPPRDWGAKEVKFIRNSKVMNGKETKIK